MAGELSVVPANEATWDDLRLVFGMRGEDPDDDSVWVVSCFVVRPGFRKRGVARALAAATPAFAHDRGARALEAYPLVVEPGREMTWGELYVGSVGMFEGAGFELVTRPTPRRAVMRTTFRR